MNLLKQHFGLYFFNRIITSGLLFLSILLFVKMAGKDVFGIYSLLNSIILFSVTYTSGWISQVILRFHHSALKRNYQVYYVAILVSIIGSLLVGIMILNGVLLTTPGTGEGKIFLFLVINVTFILVFVYQILLTLFRTRLDPGRVVKFELLRTGILLLVPLFLFLLMGKMTLNMIILGLALSYFFPDALFFWKTPKKISGLPALFSSLRPEAREVKKNLKEFFTYGIPISLWLGTAYLLNYADRYFIANFLSYTMVGEYSAVFDITNKSIGLFFLPILNAVQPIVFKFWEEDKSLCRNYLNKSIRYELYIFLPLFGIILILGPLLSNYLQIEIKRFYLLSIPIYFGTFLWQLSMIFHKVLELTKKTLLMLEFIIMAAGTNIVLNIILLPKLGIAAAAYNFLIGAAIYTVLVFRKYQTVLLNEI